jgi:hypothetical protein
LLPGKKGLNMPVFHFEKISRRHPPVTVTPTDAEPRGMIIQLLDQIAEARMQRDARAFSRMKHRRTDDDPARDRGR